MKVLYDYQCFLQRYGGVSRYFAEIMHNAPKELMVKKGFLFSENAYINEFYPNTILFNTSRFPGKGKFIVYAGRLVSMFSMLRGHYDLLHVTADDASFLKYNRKPFVITIHDMIPEFLYGKEDWVHQTWIEDRKKLIYLAAHILTVSENTKKDLLDFYPDIPQEKISVIYHGANLNATKEHLPNKWGKYLLYVGKRDSYKNYETFVSAVSPLLKQDQALKLICTGSDFSSKEIAMHDDLKISSKVIHVSADNTTLNALYQNAQLFVFPSLMEGFGIPILEAWNNSCPIALSNASCLPEIAGKGAVYFDPRDKQSILETVSSVYQSEIKKKELVALGKERLVHFSWKDSAQQLTQIYRDILEKGK